MPPAESEAKIIGWCVTRLAKLLGQVEFIIPPGREEIAYLSDPAHDTPSVLQWLEEKVTCPLDNNREPLPVIFGRQVVAYVEDLRQRACRAGLEMNDVQLNFARQREFWMIVIANGLLRGMLNQGLVEAIRASSQGLAAGLYNWLALPESAGSWPSESLRLMALQADPALISRYAEVPEDKTQPDIPILALNHLLMDEGLSVGEAVRDFERLMQG